MALGLISRLAHEYDAARMKRWKYLAAGVISAHAIIALTLYEDYSLNLAQNETQWKYFQKNKGKGAIPGYQVLYSRDRLRHGKIDVVWDSYRDDVE